MVTPDVVGKTLPKVVGGVGKVTEGIAGTITKFVSFGNILFIIIICLIVWGLYKIWKIETQNKNYLRNRRREI